MGIIFDGEMVVMEWDDHLLGLVVCVGFGLLDFSWRRRSRQPNRRHVAQVLWLVQNG